MRKPTREKPRIGQESKNRIRGLTSSLSYSLSDSLSSTSESDELDSAFRFFFFGFGFAFVAGFGFVARFVAAHFGILSCTMTSILNSSKYLHRCLISGRFLFQVPVVSSPSMSG